jgi:tyrosyl-tRNA synthetase
MDFEELLTRGVAEIIVKEELEEKLRSGRRLRLKMGFDPSRPNLHVGHLVGLRKLRQLQDLGHQVVLIVGDWTAQIGDPSGRDESRVMLDPDTVKVNAETYMQQFFTVVDRANTEIRWQSEWFGKFTLADVFNLTSRFTLGQLLAHETFRKRYEAGSPLSLMEMMYPLLQAYDSIPIQADVEFGGTDQKFNILAGRELQRMLGQPPQDVFLVPLLIGTDGRKMSKSFDNTIDLIDPPDQVYGKVMSMGDNVIAEYFRLTTDVPLAEIDQMERDMAAGRVNPRDLKMRLARELVTQLHGKAAAAAAEAEFVRVFQKRELPSDMPDLTLAGPENIVDLIARAGLAPTKSEARRLIQQGGVKLDDATISDVNANIQVSAPAILKVGKRRFLRLLPPR